MSPKDQFRKHYTKCDAELRPNICVYGLAYPTGLFSVFFFFFGGVGVPTLLLLWGTYPALWDESLLAKPNMGTLSPFVSTRYT